MASIECTLTYATAVCFEKAVRDAMEKQRATEVLMKALCLSVPSDPAFVLEVHKDVLKTRLRCAVNYNIVDIAALTGSWAMLQIKSLPLRDRNVTTLQPFMSILYHGRPDTPLRCPQPYRLRLGQSLPRVPHCLAYHILEILTVTQWPTASYLRQMTGLSSLSKYET